MVPWSGHAGMGTQAQQSGTGAQFHEGNPRPTVVSPILSEIREDGAEEETFQLPTKYYAELDSIRIPMHMPYNQEDFQNWQNLQKQSVHRLYTNNPEQVHSRPLDQLVSKPAGINSEDARKTALHDMMGWSIMNTHSEKITVPENTDPLTLNKTESREWNEPWSFKNALGADSNVKVAGNTVVGAGVRTSSRSASWHQKFVTFLLRNPFVPLILRIINIAVLSSTLAVGVRLRKSLHDVDLEWAVGMSPILAIVFTPLSLAYALFQVWLEYRSRPIGLWKASSKLGYMALELIFVCLWSAELSLSFDNYFTSTIACMSSSSPFYSHIQPVQEHIANKSTICDLQISLICLCFISVMVYLIVFLVRPCLFLHRCPCFAYSIASCWWCNCRFWLVSLRLSNSTFPERLYIQLHSSSPIR